MRFLLRCTQRWLWAVVVLLAGCGLTGGDPAGSPCETDARTPCYCVSGEGTQSCNDGKLSACECTSIDPPPNDVQEDADSTSYPDDGQPPIEWEDWPKKSCNQAPACTGQTPVCDYANSKCVQCLNDSDCGPQHGCLQNQCVQSQCPAGKSFCVGQWPAICGAEGTSYHITGACAPGTGCRQGLCEAQTCGNGVIEGTEACDSPQDPTACTAHCLRPSWDAPNSLGPYLQQVTHLALLPVGSGCDLDANGKANNVFAKMVALNPAVGELMQKELAAGHVGLAFAAEKWPAGDGPAPLALVEVSPAPGQAVCLAASPTQVCELVVHRDSLDLASPATAAVAWTVWPDAQVSGSTLAGTVLAGSGTAGGATFPLPLVLSVAQMPAELLTVTANIAPGGGWQQGQLCGYVSKQNLMAAVEAMPDQAAAAAGGKVQLKYLLSSLLAPDLDLDKDGLNDALSFAYTFDTAPATLLGFVGGKATKCVASDSGCLATCAEQQCAVQLAQCSTATQCKALDLCKDGRCTDCSSLTDGSATLQCLDACAAAACEAESAACQSSGCVTFLQCVGGCAPGSASCVKTCGKVLDGGSQAALQRREVCLAAAKRHCQ
jgi:hypothetical protein